MGVRIEHLSGSQQGQTSSFDLDLLVVGTAVGCDLRFDVHQDPAVAPRHAEIRLENGRFVLRDCGGPTLVNDVRVAQAFLQDGDVIELERGGPKLRFRVSPQLVAAGKAFRVVVSDSLARVRARPRVPVVSATAFVGYLAHALVREASPAVRAIALLLLALVAAFFVGVPILLFRGHQVQRETAQEVEALSIRLAEEQTTVTTLARDVAAAREQDREFEDEVGAAIAALSEARERLEREAGAAATGLRILEQEREAGIRIIGRYGRGVGLLVGHVEFSDAAGRPLRYLVTPGSREPIRGPDGNPLVTLEGDGPAVRAPFSGTVFVVRADGLLLTNRHVPEPWHEDRNLAPLLAAGLRPRTADLAVFFPAQRKPFGVEVRAMSEEADVALLALPEGPRNLPPLPLALGDDAARPGEPVLLLGYPAGVRALLAKAPPATVEELLAAGRTDLRAVAEALAARDLIRPSATRGHLGDVLPHRLVFDAQTAGGGSGGPLFNMAGQVVGISEAILLEFGGSNLGVPARFGAALLTATSPPP